jgi:hypothetical protein
MLFLVSLPPDENPFAIHLKNNNNNNNNNVVCPPSTNFPSSCSLRGNGGST